MIVYLSQLNYWKLVSSEFSIDLLQKSIFGCRGVSEAVARNERQHLRPDLSVILGFLSANASPFSDLCKRSIDEF